MIRIQIPSELEIEYFCDLLQLPSIVSICSNNTVNDNYISKIVSFWCEELKCVLDRQKDDVLNSEVYSPLPFELLKLPEQFNSIIEDPEMFTCKNCETPPKEPALCLLCGVILCSQSYCCSGENLKGECTIHVES